MIELIPDLPEAVVGLRFSGHVTKAEYTEVVLPALKARLQGTEKVRMLVVIDEGFDKFEAGTIWEDTKFGLTSGLSHLSKWERTALVSDAEWARHAISLFGWLVPGEVKVFALAELADAAAWVAA